MYDPTLVAGVGGGGVSVGEREQPAESAAPPVMAASVTPWQRVNSFTAARRCSASRPGRVGAARRRPALCDARSERRGERGPPDSSRARADAAPATATAARPRRDGVDFEGSRAGAAMTASFRVSSLGGRASFRAGVRGTRTGLRSGPQVGASRAGAEWYPILTACRYHGVRISTYRLTPPPPAAHGPAASPAGAPASGRSNRVRTAC